MTSASYLLVERQSAALQATARSLLMSARPARRRRARALTLPSSLGSRDCCIETSKYSSNSTSQSLVSLLGLRQHAITSRDSGSSRSPSSSTHHMRQRTGGIALLPRRTTPNGDLNPSNKIQVKLHWLPQCLAPRKIRTTARRKPPTPKAKLPPPRRHLFRTTRASPNRNDWPV